MDERVKKNPKKYRRLLERKKILPVCYCITLPANGKNCMDIYPSGEFWLDYYRRQEIEIIGLAADQKGVREILCRMTQDIIAAQGRMDADAVRRFFML